ncbi:MAG TPA: PA14 domain-containing protein, partial [Rariglobus sp.]|nr:PA14 domain-containing protein [Rariglobus sp.]
PTLDASLNGAGTGNGSLKGPLMPIFGFKEAQTGGTLVGNFYDFKQLRGAKPNPDYVPKPGTGKASGLDSGASQLAYKEVDNFVARNFSKSSLYKFFVAPDPLYTTQIFIPNMNAEDAPAAFSVEKLAKGKAWMVHYRGKISPPTSGTYRFVGLADDIMVVRMDGRLVLDASLSNSTKFVFDKPNYGNLRVGKAMQLQSGQYYPIDIAISEAPGGRFYAYLFVQEDGVTYEKNPDGTPILPLFRVAPGNTEQVRGAPAFMPNGPIWKALPAPKD